MTTKIWKFEAVLKNRKWISPGYTIVTNDGKISDVRSSLPPGKNIDENISGYFIPGFRNTHSHAFQYAMAGLTENITSEGLQDNFWTWREKMYSLALKISPDQLEALATFLYCEMLKNGYTHVVEFHYLHHDTNGQVFNNPAEMSVRLMNAAKKARINLTLVPIFYQRSGFCEESHSRQKRFLLKNTNEYFKFLDFVKSYAKSYPNVKVAAGIHSLRAVSPDDVKATCANLNPKTPFHIHISEQLKEVEECKQFLKKSPIEWLVDNTNVNEYFNLIHATHISQEEMSAIIQTNANIVLCTTTEANLGDGLFPFKNYNEKSGRWTIGSDSHIGLSPLEELRWLDYLERLNNHERNPLCKIELDDSGDLLYHRSLKNSRFALGVDGEWQFKEHDFLTGIVINNNHPLFYGKPKESILSTFIFSGNSSHLLGVIMEGDWIVIEGKHKYKSSIIKEYMKQMPVIL
ncbi:MAG: formimidoylglutamate deiminase [Bacteriovoracaceae bacterium]|jgi:formimidoylglutamate deiminase|nr:formimidoylglutamate deiminase [Bacteriovoracaceae bacterium]